MCVLPDSLLWYREALSAVRSLEAEVRLDVAQADALINYMIALEEQAI